MSEKDETHADIELDLKRAFEDEEKVRRELEARIASAEAALEAGEDADIDSLAHDYLACALEAQEDDDFEKMSVWLDKAVKLFDSTDELTDERVLLLGQVRLTYGIALNDQGMWSDALAEYDAAEKLLEKLSGKNLDALLDLAGIRLNIATIQFEIGEYDDSMAAFEKVKSDFASLFGTDKESEAYYYLAKTYLQEAAVCREIGDDDKALQRLEEGIALYRKMLEESDDTETSVDLANALATYAECLECSGAGSDEILPYVEEAVERMQGGIAAGRADVCPDLLNTSVTKGRLLNYLSRSDDAEMFLTETVEIFEGIRDTEDPSALLCLVTLHNERGKARYALKRYKDALADFDDAADIAGRLPDGFFEEDEEDCGCEDDCCCEQHRIMRSEGNLTLFSVYMHRAKVLKILNRISEAKIDCRKAGEILPKVKDYLDGDYSGYEEMYNCLLNNL